MPAMIAATAVRVVNVFIVWLLVGLAPALRQSEQREERDRVPGTSKGFGKNFKCGDKMAAAGIAPGRRHTVIAIEKLRLNDSDNLVRAWINDHDLVTHQDVIISTPFRIDDDHLLRERIQAHIGRNAGSDADRYVQPDRFDLLRFDDRSDLCALLGRQLCRSSRTLAGGGAILLHCRLS